MHIHFGWGYDGARWSHEDSLRRYTAGPTGLTSLLATRLGLTIPAASQVQRIAVYRQVLERHVADVDNASHRPWFADSFAKDPWATARQVLTWRDELVGAGWHSVDYMDAAMPSRLQTLAQIETALDQESNWSVGGADVLRDVAGELQWLVASQVPFPLGIETISLEHAPSKLPPTWQRVFDHLEVLGVEIVPAPQVEPLTQLRILHAESEWDAAAIATRAVQAHVDAPFTLVAGRSTQLLDAELARYGLPTAGVREPGRARTGVQLLAVFVAAAMTPHDVHALANLLDIPLAVQQSDNGVRRQIRLLPNAVRKALLRALSEQPGVGGSAWSAALQAVQNSDNERHAELAADFDRAIRVDPITSEGSKLNTQQVIDHLDWLARRLKALRGGLGETSQTHGLDVAVTHMSIVIDVLDHLDSTVSVQELQAVINDSASEIGPVIDSQRQSASAVMDVVTSPAHLGTGSAPVVWWLPLEDTAAQRSYSRAAEIDYLQSIGIQLPSPEDLAALHLESQIRAARRRQSVTAILPATTITGDAVGPHSLLTFLLDDMRSQQADLSLDAISQQATSSVDDIFPVETVTPPTVELTTRSPVHWELAVGEHLIPSRISFSQWERILTHPADWLLDRQLQIKVAERTRIPTDNRMVGLWMHATVEVLLQRHLREAQELVPLEVTETDIRETLLELLPDHASELLLPGYRRKRATILSQGARAIHALFAGLRQAGTRITGVESSFECEVPNTRGQHGEPLRLSGLRDLDVVFSDGRPGLIDMKYTNSKSRYHDQVRTGQAMQLVVYAHSIREDHSGLDRGIVHIPSAYFMLKDGELLTEFNGFGAREVISLEPNESGASSADELWQRAVNGINVFFDNLREGVLLDFGKLVERDEWKAYELAMKKGDNATVPRDGQLYGPLQTARLDGFIPDRSYRDRNYDLIAGVKEL